MGEPSGFDWWQSKNGDVTITHRNKTAAVLRGTRAVEFTEAVEAASERDRQLLMARLTGNYKRGNERHARQHPRNRNR